MNTCSCRHTALSHGYAAILIRGSRRRTAGIFQSFSQNGVARLPRWDCTLLWLAESLQGTIIHQICERSPCRIIVHYLLVARWDAFHLSFHPHLVNIGWISGPGPNPEGAPDWLAILVPSTKECFMYINWSNANSHFHWQLSLHNYKVDHF